MFATHIDQVIMFSPLVLLWLGCIALNYAVALKDVEPSGIKWRSTTEKAYCCMCVAALCVVCGPLLLPLSGYTALKSGLKWW